MIGIFDSGVGGLSIYKTLKEAMPNTKVIYLADTANFPYGEKSDGDLIKLCAENVRKLTSAGANIIVIACNSATVTAIKELRKKFSVPFVGVEPAVKVAVNTTSKNAIGLIATKATVNNHNGEHLVSTSGKRIIKEHKSDLVKMVEQRYSDIDEQYLYESLHDLVDLGIDSVVLGCTHYFFLKERLEKIFPDVSFHAPDVAIAKRVVDLLTRENISIVTGLDIFWVTGDKESFENTFRQIFGRQIVALKV